MSVTTLACLLLAGLLPSIASRSDLASGSAEKALP